jgi:adenylate cyclase
MKASRLLAGAARLCAELGRAADSDEAVKLLLDGAQLQLGLEHTALMLLDEGGKSLFTVATRGFSPSGVGSEQRLGEGVWGKVAERQAPLRILNLGRHLLYARTVRSAAERAGDERLTREIALPGLAKLESVLAMPLLVPGELLGVIAAQSADPLAFDGDDENALSMVASIAAQKLWSLRDDGVDEPAAAEPATSTPMATRSARVVQHYRADDSIFVDHNYVIKGLPGRILWTLLREHAGGRSAFSNRELRVNSALRLSEIRDNLESRLILLRNRLEEKACGIRLAKRGRGLFALEVAGSLELVEV